MKATSLLEPFLKPVAGFIVRDDLTFIKFSEATVDFLAKVELRHNVFNRNGVRKFPDHLEDGVLRRHVIILSSISRKGQGELSLPLAAEKFPYATSSR
jgi:hypothetical protein